MENNKNYYIGLDIGTNSVGYAITDENYNIVRKKGKDFWGVRLFEEAKQCEDRRIKRANRRRNERKKIEKSWLNEIFAEEVAKIDSELFLRMKYASLIKEDFDKQSSCGRDNILFKDKDYTDKDYFKEYHTIYHLRSELLDKPAKDVRFLYLALYSIIKHRGHFLLESDLDTESSDSIMQDINVSIDLYLDLFGNQKYSIAKLDRESETKFLDSLTSGTTIKDLKNLIKELLFATEPKEKLVAEAFITGKVNVTKLFDLEEKVPDIDFSTDNYEIPPLPEECIKLLLQIEKTYKNIQLRKILSKHDYICQALKDEYELHRNQLKNLKEFIKKYYPKKDERHSIYSQVFRSPYLSSKSGVSNYSLYTDNCYVNNKKIRVNLKSNEANKLDDFYSFLKKILENKPTLDNYNVEEFENEKAIIISQIENKTFLNKLRTTSNSVLPNKLFVKEAKRILKTNATKFEFLNSKDENGMTVSDKIISILEFRVPYFVGPITTKDSQYKWAVIQNKNLPLRPWTLDKIVDMDKTEFNFIQRMTNNCTYFKDKDVLPKCSLLYSKFSVLNELNKVKVDGYNLPVNVKQDFYKKVILKKKKVNSNDIKKYLIENGKYLKEDKDNIVITGLIDDELKNNMASYITLSNVFGEDFVKNNTLMMERIIFLHTVLSDKNRVVEIIKKEYPDLSEDYIKKIKSLVFAKWGVLSQEFITQKFTDVSSGEITSIIEELFNTNQNLQEIINNNNYYVTEHNCLFSQYINNYNTYSGEITYDDIKGLFVPPAVKRGVNQTFNIIREVEKIMGKKPQKIFVEVTRKDEEKKQKPSRKKKLIEIYKSKGYKEEIEKFGIDLNHLLAEINKEEYSETYFSGSDKLYLYFMQNGKSMYSGKPIDINSLFDDNIYDIDHIIPQSIIKDDSLDNRVLVEKVLNNDKKDTYPIYTKFPEWVNNNIDYWKFLKDKKMISEKKYLNLIRKEELDDDELNAFVNRQITQTNQENKVVIDILKHYMDKPENVIFSKAHYVSEFRKNNDIFKSREINDYHHAKDAYLNIVVGDVLYNRFTKPYGTAKLTGNTDKLFDYPVYNLSGKMVWNGTEDKNRIINICQKNSCLISYMPLSNKNGAFYDETIYKAINTVNKIPLKGKGFLNDTSKYGGYTTLNNSFFMVVQSEYKKGKKITIEAVPTLIYQNAVKSSDKDKYILDYLTAENKLVNPCVLLPELKKRSLIMIDNGKYLITGKTNDQLSIKNVNQWNVNNTTTAYIKIIEKYIKKSKDKNWLDNTEKTDDMIVVAKGFNKQERYNKKPKLQVLTKTENLNLYNILINQLNKPFMHSNHKNVAQTLTEKTEKFTKYNVQEQASLLFNIIQYLTGTKQNTDLHLLSDDPSKMKAVGALTLGKNITDLNIAFLAQSPTGMYDKVLYRVKTK